MHIPNLREKHRINMRNMKFRQHTTIITFQFHRANDVLIIIIRKHIHHDIEIHRRPRLDDPDLARLQLAHVFHRQVEVVLRLSLACLLDVGKGLFVAEHVEVVVAPSFPDLRLSCRGLGWRRFGGGVVGGLEVFNVVVADGVEDLFRGFDRCPPGWSFAGFGFLKLSIRLLNIDFSLRYS